MSAESSMESSTDRAATNELHTTTAAAEKPASIDEVIFLNKFYWGKV